MSLPIKYTFLLVSALALPFATLTGCAGEDPVTPPAKGGASGTGGAVGSGGSGPGSGGAVGSGGAIGPDATLIFEVELLGIE